MDFKQLFNFLAHLEVYNDRNWFNEHKEEYNHARGHYEAFIDVLIPAIAQFDPSVSGVTAAECIFRIYRDVRFSPDKRPYKTHFGAFIAHGGRKTRLAGYYIHLQPDHSFLSGGVYMPEAADLAAIRNEIFLHPDEFRAILDDKKFSQYFPELSGEDRLKNPPKGFPRDFKEVEVLKNKHFITQYPLANHFFFEDNLVERLVEICRVQYPLNEFLNRALR